MAGPATLFQTGDHASLPAADAGCVLYNCTDHNLVYVSSGSSWSTYIALASGIADSTFNAKGDLLSASADDTPAIVSAGPDGSVPLYDSGETAGIRSLKHNLGASDAPDADDDLDGGWEPGSLWFDTTNGDVYGCLDNSDGAAVWAQLNGGGSGSAAVWEDAGETWTYAAADDPTYTLTISGDKTTKYSAGMRVRVSQSTGGTKYFIITKVAYSDPNTTLTLYGGTDYDLANEAISSPYYSSAKAPFGFPLDPLKWTVETKSTSLVQQTSPSASTWYNIGSINIVIPIGSWRVLYQASHQRGGASALAGRQKTTLSTANNTESDADWTSASYHQDLIGVEAQLSREKHLLLASKTTYYLNTWGDEASWTSLLMRGDVSPTIIRAICAYL